MACGTNWSTSTSVTEIIVSDTEIIVSDSRVFVTADARADAFNKHFCLGRSRLPEASIAGPRQLTASALASLDCSPISVSLHEVDHALSKLRNKSAPGPDGLGAPLLRNLPVTGREALRSIAEVSLNTGEVPRSWRAEQTGVVLV